MSVKTQYHLINILTTSAAPKSSLLIIYTGGTFGMVYDDEGSLSPFDFSMVLEKIPELQNLDLKLTVISFSTPVDSSNIDIEQWQYLGQVISDHYHDFDGFVVLHGTDTMAYSASALSFMLEGLTKPVIFTGAQISIGATRSDARENLIAALEIASQRDGDRPMISEVCIYFNYYLLRGNRAQKIRSSNFAAFESENYPYLAEAGVEIMFNDAFIHRPAKKLQLTFKPQMNPDMVILKIFPNISRHVVECILSIGGLKGVVLESFGSGNVMSNGWFISLLDEYIKKDLIVLNVSQCMGGSVKHGRYETSKKLSEIGVISGSDLTTESAVTKMMFLCGNEESVEGIKNMLAIPLRGEMTTAYR